MPKNIPLKVTRVFLVLVGLLSGFMIGEKIYIAFLAPINILPDIFAVWVGVVIIFSLLFAVIGFFIARPLLNALVRSARFLEQRLANVPFKGLVAGTLGLIAGLVVATLTSSAVKELPIIGPYMPIVLTLLFGYLGASLGYHWRDMLSALTDMPAFSRRSRKDTKQPMAQNTELQGVGHPKVLDTSVIIDGRIVDIARTGFLEGPLVITQFVLDELRHIADSGDPLKRNRGRRGLDILNELQELDVQVVTISKDYEHIPEVDAKLVQLAKEIGGYVVTNDFNLNKVASFQKVRVLNVNELAGAIKTVVLPGEEMTVEIVARGKGADQGVGYLDDGTMIVVEGGRNHIGETHKVVVTSVIQTNAGRMIFVRLED